MVIVPILTMRVIAEARKQKTDQLLYSLPIPTTQVVIGKYLALLTVYLIPVSYTHLDVYKRQVCYSIASNPFKINRL